MWFCDVHKKMHNTEEKIKFLIENHLININAISIKVYNVKQFVSIITFLIYEYENIYKNIRKIIFKINIYFYMKNIYKSYNHILFSLICITYLLVTLYTYKQL